MMPFQKIPILLPGNPEENEPDKTVIARILPGEIESYNDGYHFGCLIKFKSGEIIMVEATADQVEMMIGQYWQKFNEMARKQGRLYFFNNSIFHYASHDKEVPPGQIRSARKGWSVSH